MLNFSKLIDTNFSVVESVRVYLDMILYLAIPIVKTALLSTVFILFGQAVFSLFPRSAVTNICFWIWIGFIFSISTASFFKTSEDLVLNKVARIYANIASIFVLSAKLFTVVGIILGAITLLMLPMVYIKSPLFVLPYKVLAGIFIIAAIPFVYFAPLAVALHEANILNSFTFSYYMVLQRWKNISKSIMTQIVFTGIIAFWAYFIVSLLFFPNSSDFFNFIFTQASSLVEQSRSLYVRFVFWEIVQIFVFTFVSGTFVGMNTILFLYLEGSISKILQEENKVIIKRNIEKHFNDVKFVDVLEQKEAVTIDTKSDEETIHHKTRKEVLNEIYPGYLEEDFFHGEQKDSSSPKDDVIIIEDNYSK